MLTEHPPGWTCEVVVVRLERYRLGTLPWGESLAIAEHLEACVLCYERCMGVEPTGAGPGRGG
jgi:anti-sigma factor ChrR (cupin superfamily)